MKHLYLALAGLAGGGTLLLAGSQLTAHPQAADAAFTITIAPTPPHDLPPGSDSVLLARFAWEEFFALNWQASYGNKKLAGTRVPGRNGTPTPIDSLRDYPDPTWTYRNKDATLTVWETYAHRTELRPYNNVMLPFDQAPHYSYLVQPQPSSPVTTLNLFNNLDENSEIGSCTVYGQVPPADTTLANDARMVLYQAKANREEYDYVRTNYPTRQQLAQATQLTQHNLTRYNAYYKPDTLNNRYKGQTCECPPGVICLPCGGVPLAGRPGEVLQGRTRVGAMEVKTAWRRLQPSEDPTRFLTRKVVYYTQRTRQLVLPTPNPNKRGGADTIAAVTDTTASIYHNEVFALIGMHIIHKTKNYPDFVFATWEHVDVAAERDQPGKGENMAYRLLNANGSNYQTGPIHAPYYRRHRITAVANQATAEAHRQLRALNPHSVLLNYRLVGVQGTPTSNPATSNFFLANYVIESDDLLANFHGSGFAHPHNDSANTVYLGQRLSAGGCQGCHGVAQQQEGTDFSFLLDNTKPVRYPDPNMAQYAPPATAATAATGNARRILFSPAQATGKLARYIRATQSTTRPPKR